MTLWRTRDVYRVQAVSRGWCCCSLSWNSSAIAAATGGSAPRHHAPVWPAVVSALGAQADRPVGPPGPVVEYRSRPERRADLAARAQEVTHAARTNASHLGPHRHREHRAVQRHRLSAHAHQSGGRRTTQDGVFHSPTACELYRQTMQQKHRRWCTVRPASVTVRKQITYTCHEGEEAL